MNNKKVYMAIDIGTKLGWAIGTSINKSGYLDGGTKLLLKKGDPDAQRYMNLKNLLEEKISVYKPSKIYYEKVWRHTGVLAAHVYGALESQIKMACEISGIPFGLYTPTEIKKKFTGYGHASKECVMTTLSMSEWDIKAVDDNHADACALLYVAMCDEKFDEKTTSQKDKD